MWNRHNVIMSIEHETNVHPGNDNLTTMVRDVRSCPWLYCVFNAAYV